MDEELSRQVATLLAMASGVKGAISNREADLRRLTGELMTLDGRVCTGREWWRDKEHPTRMPKMYVLHGVDQACPLHGTPAVGDRLRVYVGSDSGNIEAAREAMERETHRQRLEREVEAIGKGLTSCGWALRRFYDHLGYRVRDDGVVELRR